jgi:hypothetical protein
MMASVADAEDASSREMAPRHACAHYRFYGHAEQLPSRPPDHQLPIRYGHGVQRLNRDLGSGCELCW